MLRKEVEQAKRRCLKAGKSPGVDNTPTELFKNGREATTVLTAMCKKIWKTQEIAEGVAEAVDTIARQRKATPGNVGTILPST